MTDSKYFFCEKSGNRIAKTMCVFWQERARREDRPPKSLAKCLDCEQGRRIAAELKADSS